MVRRPAIPHTAVVPQCRTRTAGALQWGDDTLIDAMEKGFPLLGELPRGWGWPQRSDHRYADPLPMMDFFKENEKYIHRKLMLIGRPWPSTSQRKYVWDAWKDHSMARHRGQPRWSHSPCAATPRHCWRDHNNMLPPALPSASCKSDQMDQTKSEEGRIGGEVSKIAQSRWKMDPSTIGPWLSSA